VEKTFMNLSQSLQLIFIAAIWGASHVFVRVIAPAVGPAFTAFARIGIGAITLQVALLFMRERFLQKNYLKHFWVVGLTNYAIPLTLFAYASIRLPATYLVILNATAPIFSAILSSLFLSDPFGWKKIVSLCMGMSGVYLLTEYGSIQTFDFATLAALVFCALAAASYAVCGVYIKKRASHVPSMALTTGSTWAAFLLVSPLELAQSSLPSLSSFTLPVTLSLFTLGMLGTALAFLILYRLLKTISAFRASLVSFLMPVFGMLWGKLFLSEEITPGMYLGAFLVISSTALFMKRSVPRVSTP
jgi:drug/metabolite transporter (DMT)-like permease